MRFLSAYPSLRQYSYNSVKEGGREGRGDRRGEYRGSEGKMVSGRRREVVERGEGNVGEW